MFQLHSSSANCQLHLNTFCNQASKYIGDDEGLSNFCNILFNQLNFFVCHFYYRADRLSPVYKGSDDPISFTELDEVPGVITERDWT